MAGAIDGLARSFPSCSPSQTNRTLPDALLGRPPKEAAAASFIWRPFERDKDRHETLLASLTVSQCCKRLCKAGSKLSATMPSSSCTFLGRGLPHPSPSFRNRSHAWKFLRVAATSADKAQSYPKKQTGVTLKWMGPRTSSDRNLTKTVLESICSDGTLDEQRVECKIETVAWRKRHISASVEVAANAECVWRVLTDYERLADFIPNLAKR